MASENPLPSPLSAVEMQLIEALAKDTRQPTNELAKTLDLSVPTTRRLLNNLVKHEHLYLGPLVDISAAGYRFVLIIGIQVEGHPPRQVAEQVANIEGCIAVNLVYGEQDIELGVVLDTHSQISQLLFETLPLIPGVSNLSPSLAIDVWKFQHVKVDSRQLAAQQNRPLLDETDKAIIEQLKQSIRLSNRKIASAIGVTESTVRVRLKRMQEQQQVKLIAMPSLERYRDLRAAYIGIDVQGGKANSVCHALAALPETNFVASTLGSHDIICCVRINHDDVLTQLLQQTLPSIEGIKKASASFPIANVKFDDSLGMLL